MPAQVWESIRRLTNQIVDTPEFDTVVEACPYFEGWWRVELSRRFVNGRRGSLRLAGFDVLAICGEQKDQGKGWALDLLLDRQDGASLSVVWTELKLLNLLRKRPKAVSESKFHSKVGSSLSRMCRDFRHVWECVDSVHPKATARRFASARDLQNFTLKRRHLEKPEALYRSNGTTHLAAAFMLAIIPPEWEEKFWGLIEKALRPADAKGAALFQTRGSIKPLRECTSYRVHLVGAVGRVRTTR